MGKEWVMNIYMVVKSGTPCYCCVEMGKERNKDRTEEIKCSYKPEILPEHKQCLGYCYFSSLYTSVYLDFSFRKILLCHTVPLLCSSKGRVVMSLPAMLSYLGAPPFSQHHQYQEGLGHPKPLRPCVE